MRALICTMILAAAAPAFAQDGGATDAKSVYANGVRLYDEGRYADAITAFEAAYELSGKPALLFNISNAHERLGHLPEAIEYLNQYRVFAPPEDQDTLSSRVMMLERRLEEEGATPPADAAVAAGPPAPASTDSSTTLERRGNAGPIVLATVGGLLAVGGGVVAGVTASQAGDMRVAGDEAGWSNTRPVNNVAFGTAVGGGALMVGGIGWGLLGASGPRLHIGPRYLGATFRLK